MKRNKDTDVFRSIGEYIKSNSLEITKYKLEKLIGNKLEHTEKMSVRKQYRDIDSIVIEENLHCTLEKDNPLKSLYVLNIFIKGKETDFIKIGISADVEQRIASLNEGCKEYDIVFKLNSCTKKLNTANTLETAILDIAKSESLNVDLGVHFSGKTEVIKVTERTLTLIEAIAGLAIN